MFIKYPKIINYKTLKYDRLSDEIKNDKYIVTEKIDGANIQIDIDKSGIISVLSRNGNTNLYHIQNYIHKLDYLVYDISKLCRDNNYCIKLYGEYYGNKVIKRVDYGENNFKFYGMIVNDILYTSKDFLNFFLHNKFNEWVVPFYGKFKLYSLKDALALTPYFKSSLSNNDAEGFVISSYNNIYYHNSNLFKVKVKSDKFLDTCSSKFNIDIEDPDILKYRELFQTYITDNRIIDVISKIGSDTLIQTIIKEVLIDAREDFKDNLDKEFNKTSLNKICKLKKSIFNQVSNILNNMRSKE